VIVGVETRGFRNLEDLCARPGEGALLLMGGTGSGKTSLLEAVYLATTTKSFRTSKLTDCCRHGSEANGFLIHAEVAGTSRISLEVGLGSEGSWRRVNGEVTPLARHLSAQPVLAWTSAETEVLTGEPELRRRFVDRGLVGERPRALEALQRYRKVLRQKRSLLLGPGRSPGKDDLTSCNLMLARSIVEVAAERAGHCERLEASLHEVLNESRLGYPALSVRYKPSPEVALNGEAEVLDRLETAAPDEIRRKRPLLGIHRDRIEVLWNGLAVGRVASAGERKAVGLSLLAAQSRLLERASRSPLLLLDDLDTELDRPTLERVWTSFSDHGQVFVSSNRPEVWEGLRMSSRWELDRGRVKVD